MAYFLGATLYIISGSRYFFMRHFQHSIIHSPFIISRHSPIRQNFNKHESTPLPLPSLRMFFSSFPSQMLAESLSQVRLSPDAKRFSVQLVHCGMTKIRFLLQNYNKQLWFKLVSYKALSLTCHHAIRKLDNNISPFSEKTKMDYYVQYTYCHSSHSSPMKSSHRISQQDVKTSIVELKTNNISKNRPLIKFERGQRCSEYCWNLQGNHGCIDWRKIYVFSLFWQHTIKISKILFPITSILPAYENFSTNNFGEWTVGLSHQHNCPENVKLFVEFTLSCIMHMKQSSALFWSEIDLLRALKSHNHIKQWQCSRQLHPKYTLISSLSTLNTQAY